MEPLPPVTGTDCVKLRSIITSPPIVSYFQRNKEVISPNIINDTIRRLEAGESLTSIAEDLQKHISVLSVAVRSATGKKASSFKPLFSRKNEKRERAFELIRTGATFSGAACQVG